MVGLKNSMMAILVATTGITLTACSTEGASEADMNVVNIETPVASETLPRFQSEENGVYFYVTGLTDEERKAGKVAGDVVQYRFGGMENGQVTLFQEDGNGVKVGTVTCAIDCRIIAYKAEGGGITRLPFEPSTVLGNALMDAIEGHMTEGVQAGAEDGPVQAATSRPFTATEQRLIDQADEFGNRCRDTEGATNPSVCDQTQVLVEKLKTLDICHGPYSEIEANKTWMRCTPEDSRANRSQ